MSDRPTLRQIAEYVPYGWECRGCGGSAYNWLCKAARYVETGEGCCAEFREWVRKAQAGEPTVEDRRAERLALREWGLA